MAECIAGKANKCLTRIVLAGSISFSFRDDFQIEPDKSYWFISVTIIIAYSIGFKLIYKDWGYKKTFVLLHVLPITLAFLSIATQSIGILEIKQGQKTVGFLFTTFTYFSQLFFAC